LRSRLSADPEPAVGGAGRSLAAAAVPTGTADATRRSARCARSARDRLWWQYWIHYCLHYLLRRGYNLPGPRRHGARELIRI